MMKLNLILVAILMSAHVANAEDKNDTTSSSDAPSADPIQSTAGSPVEEGETQSTPTSQAPATSSAIPSAPTSEPTTPTSTDASTTQPTVTDSDTTTNTATTAAATTTAKAISNNFDAGSFVGGFVLCGAIVLLIYIGCKLFRNKKPDYNTI